jgi:hypothetical protein
MYYVSPSALVLERKLRSSTKPQCRQFWAVSKKKTLLQNFMGICCLPSPLEVLQIYVYS